MLRSLDAITDAINKLLDKAQEVAPTVWAAALKQASIDGRLSLYWGIFWTGVTLVALAVVLLMSLLYVGDKRTFKREQEKLEADYALKLAAYREKEAKKEIQTYGYGPDRQFAKRTHEENVPIYSTIGGISIFLAILTAVLALYSYWNAYQISNNPTWYAIHLLKNG